VRRPEFYYFECVQLLEKLMLTGLLIFIDQGSIFQAFCGGCVAFLFFAVQCSARPYANTEDNILKVSKTSSWPRSRANFSPL